MSVFTPQQIADTISTIAGELETSVQGSMQAAGASPQLMQQVTAGIDGLKQASSALGTAETTAQAQPIIQRIMTDSNAVLGALTLLPLPGPAKLVVQIAEVMLPTLIASANILFRPFGQAAPHAQQEQAAPGTGEQPQVGQQFPPQDQPAAPAPQPGQQPTGQQPSASGEPGANQGAVASNRTAARSDAPQGRPGPGARR